jgi:protease I
MTGKLNGCMIAVLATDGVEQVELMAPVAALRGEGAEVHVVSDKKEGIQGFNHHDKGDEIKVDMPLDEADADQYDGLVLPGGVINPDALRLQQRAIDFVHHFVKEGLPIAAICHGPWTLIDAGGVSGKLMTSWPSLKTDLANAGARWVDEPVVVEANLVTSRKPDDLPLFNAKMIDMFEQAAHRPVGGEAPR